MPPRWQHARAMDPLTRDQFEALVRDALTDLPDEFVARLENVDVVAEQEPSQGQLRTAGVEEDSTLLGLYEGVPITARENYGFVLPDKITIFQRPIESMCGTPQDILEEVRETVVHEVAHHFGIGDEALREMGL